MAVGATVEDERVRPAAEAAAALALSRLRYGVDGAENESQWFNSGVLLMSWVPLGMVARLSPPAPPPLSAGPPVREERRAAARRPDAPLERSLHWDQGFLNAMRLRDSAPLADLGYAFNFVGSFETSNKASRPFAAEDAFMVHGTTGLLMAPDDRAAWLRGVVGRWTRRGL